MDTSGMNNRCKDEDNRYMMNMKYFNGILYQEGYDMTDI
jgi:hypothetical protein